MRCLYLLIVLALGSESRVHPRTAFVDLGQAKGGPVVLHGNVLPDTVFRLEAKVRIAGKDTTWNGLYLNRLAVRAPDPPRASIEVPEYIKFRSATDAGVLAVKDRFLEQRRRLNQPATIPELMAVMVAEYRKSVLVERADTISNHEFEVCWKGDESCERHSFNTVPHTVVAKSDLIRSEANEILTFLRHGRMVFISRGTKFAPPADQKQKFLDELVALKNGKPPDQSVFPVKRFAVEIKRPPVSLEALKQGGGHDDQ